MLDVVKIRFLPAFFFGVTVSIMLGVMFNLWILKKELLETSPTEYFNLIINIATLGGVLVAGTAFIYTRNQDISSTIDKQLTFFREEILGKEGLFVENLNRLGLPYIKIPLNSLDADELNTHFRTEFSLQNRISKMRSSDGKSLKSFEVDILNSLEIFAHGVLNFRTTAHPSMIAVRKVYVDTVQSHVVTLLWLRDREYGSNAFLSTIKLYKEWSPLVHVTKKDALVWQEQ